MNNLKTFRFISYDFDGAAKTATFTYGFDDTLTFTEKVQFNQTKGVEDQSTLDAALRLAFIVAGTSYYKCFPKVETVALDFELDEFQADFFTRIYQEGLSQFAFENQLTRNDLINFVASAAGKKYGTVPAVEAADPVVMLQSGGKDSLLTAALMKKLGRDTVPTYMQYSPTYPELLNKLGEPLTFMRYLDHDGLAEAKKHGALNGHVPITYIVSAYALIQAILLDAKTIVLSVGHEGDEPHGYVGDLPVNHQWAKTWPAEQAMAEYVGRYVDSGIAIGSILRPLTELAVAELFVQYCWEDFGHEFSSCNRANYMQGHNNKMLKWCGECPKCANNFLLFAPFVEPQELMSLFNGQNLFAKPMLLETWKGLLGIDGVMKPLECVGETDELRLAYHMAVKRWGSDTYSLPFAVFESTFDYKKRYDAQPWAENTLNKALSV
jgi:hypothetical protein